MSPRDLEIVRQLLTRALAHNVLHRFLSDVEVNDADEQIARIEELQVRQERAARAVGQR